MNDFEPKIYVYARMGRRMVATGGAALQQSRHRVTRGTGLGLFLASQGATEK